MLQILVVGGSGYLGQFLVLDLAMAGHKIAFTHNSTSSPKTPGDVHPYWVDLATGEGLAECLAECGPLAAVVNCAAVSSPALCEKDPARARAVNVPTRLLDALDVHAAQHGARPFLIHLSTDQVYDGTKAHWHEEDACHPVNVYGRTKLEAEQLIQARWPEHVILRSSIIYGPQCPTPVSRLLFLQFISRALGGPSPTPTTFFEDEFRSPVYVRDITALVAALIQHRAALPHRLYNMGGPQRLSRADMARAVAAAWDYPVAAIRAAPAASMPRGVTSPPDISMDSTRLAADIAAWGVQLMPFAKALAVMGKPPPEEARGSFEARRSGLTRALSARSPTHTAPAMLAAHPSP